MKKIDNDVDVLEFNKDIIAQRAKEEIDVKYVLDLRDFPGDKVEKVTVLGTSGTKEMQIRDCYIVNGSYETKKADSNLEQYIVRSADNLTNFPNITPEKADVFYFAGVGWGHGIGMSQSGAKGMAKAGYNYKDIIAYYFTGAEVK